MTPVPILLRLTPVLMLLLAPLAAWGQTLPPAIVAVVDFQRVLREATAAVDIRTRVERQRQAYQDQITREEQELRAADQQLTQQRAILSADAFNEKRRLFEERVAEVQRRVQARKRELEEASAQGFKQIEQAVAGIIAELAKERGFNIVLARRQIMFADGALNISEDLIGRLNAKLPTVTLALPSN